MTLCDLPAFAPAIVTGVRDLTDTDTISRRLRELGFVDGEEGRVVGRGPLGREPLLVQVGFTRFALRRAEADRVQVEAVALREAAE